MGEANTVLHIVALINVIVITIKYFVTKKVPNHETKIYGRLLIAILAENVTVLTLFMAMAKMPPLLMNIVHGLYLSCLITWIGLFALYISRVAEENDKSFAKTEKFLLITGIISCILAIILPREISTTDINETAAGGAAVQVTAIYSGLCFLIIIYNIFKNSKKLFDKKFIPLFVLLTTSLMFFGGQGVLTKMFPQLFLITPCEGYIVFIMFFTIENPDVKMLLKVENARDIAEKANRAKSDFLSSMSHEIRTPLNAIVGLTEDNLQYQDNCPKEVNENSKDIVTASQNLLEIVGNILDINKIEANKIEIVNQPYNFKEEITNICNITKTRIGEKNIEFHLSIDENIPNELIGDKGKIKEIINNILTNAIKYTDKGHINLDITCENREDSKMAYLTIICKDTGKGIKEEDLPKLFTKFERLDVEQNSTIEGTGLGLLITKEILTLMGGKIEVKSTYKVGTTVIIKVPQMINKETKIVEQKENTENQKEEIVIDNLEPVDYTNKKILIVDDNKLNIKVARRALKDFNIQIDECYDGQECLNKITNGNEYDLILMDIMMPNMNGEKALKKLKENPNFHIPTIALTADAVAGAKEKYEEAGFDDFIMKPFHKEEIKEKLEKMFRLTAKSSKAKEEVL